MKTELIPVGNSSLLRFYLDGIFQGYRSDNLLMLDIVKRFPKWSGEQVVAHYDRLTNVMKNPHGELREYTPKWMKKAASVEIV